MPHELYDVNSSGLLAGSYYNSDNLVQMGQGPTYSGFRFQQGYGGYRRRQRGRGVGGVLKKVWKYLAPMAKKYLGPLAKQALTALAEEGLDAGQKVLSDVKQGTDLKEAVVTQGTEAFDKILKRAGSSLQAQRGSGKRSPRKRSVTTLNLVGRSVLDSAAKKSRLGQTHGLY